MGAAAMNLLSVVLGMLLVFLVFAVVVSRLREWLAQWTCDRGAYLRVGIFRMINDDAISLRVLQHPLVSGLYRDPTVRGRPPSYLEPATFALALANVLVRRGAPPQEANLATDGTQVPAGRSAEQPLTLISLRDALSSFARQSSPVASSLLPIVDRAGTDLDAALKGIENWFATSMERVSGWYKTRARRQVFWIGLAIAALVNVDAIQIFQHLNRNPSEAATLADVARQIGTTGKVGDVDFNALKDRPPSDQEWNTLMAAVQDRKLIGTLPIGYACLGALSATTETTPTAQPRQSSRRLDSWDACQIEIGELFAQSPAQWLVKLLGWVLTAFAGSLGASYWFSAITKVVNIRSSGPPPSRPENGKAVSP